MTLQQIYYALTIASCGSMNQAAQKLYISQPTLTSAIRELEKETGITIFTRTSRGVRLTNEGNEFLMYARQLYQQFELLKERYTDNENQHHSFGVSTQHYSFAVKAFVETVNRYGLNNYAFSIQETKTIDVINDVGNARSEVGILYRSNFNRKYITKLLDEHELEFHPLTAVHAYVYLYKDHPLANNTSITFEELRDYPCLSFDQGENGSMFLAEEILVDNEYARIIKTNDRATMLNLMVGLHGYTLCSGMICEELNGSDYIVVPFESDEINPNTEMEIGYIVKKHSILSDIAETYIEELKSYVNADTVQA